MNNLADIIDHTLLKPEAARADGSHDLMTSLSD